jgi:plasmid stabilization system protein ParE
MRFKFHPEARVEYLEAIGYYEERRAGLGGRFALEIEGVIQRIVEAPRRWRSVEGEIRRCLAHKFPYGVLYSIEADYVLILAVMHHSRKPGYWRNRAG